MDGTDHTALFVGCLHTGREPSPNAPLPDDARARPDSPATIMRAPARFAHRRSASHLAGQWHLLLVTIIGLVVVAAAWATASTYSYDGMPHLSQRTHVTSPAGDTASTSAYSVAAPRATGVAAGVAAEAGSGEADTFLYQKLSSAGEHLKYGITKNPATRYTSAEMDGGRLNILASGTKSDMLALERSLHEWMPIGPEEGQTFYILKQIANGLRPPPYDW
jgi:hypothetical protein